jgi:large subunit ribosomal protein L13
LTDLTGPVSSGYTYHPVKTTLLKSGELKTCWYLIDAKDLVLGRLATRVATLLRGKHRASFTPSLPQGDTVIVINAAKIRLTGDKLNQKMLKRYTLYPGGLKQVPYSEVMAKHPERALRRAVWGMLSRRGAARRQIRALKIYKGAEHPHTAQKPVKVDVSGRLFKMEAAANG